MVSDIELEIAMSIIQLTGVTLPILLGITRYYLKNEKEINEVLENHPEIPTETALDRFVPTVLFGAGIALFLTYLFAAGVLALINNYLLFLSIGAYGAFLMALFLAIPISLGQKVKGALLRLVSAGLLIPGVVFAFIMFFALYYGSYGNALISFIWSVFLSIPGIILYLLAKKADSEEADEPDEPAAEAVKEPATDDAE